MSSIAEQPHFHAADNVVELVNIITVLNRLILNTLRHMNDDVTKSQSSDENQIQCPVCKRKVRSRAVQCVTCYNWVHYQCDKIDSDTIAEIETPGNLYLYRCTQCSIKHVTINSEPIEYTYDKVQTNENSHITAEIKNNNQDKPVITTTHENSHMVAEIANNIEIKEIMLSHENSHTDSSLESDNLFTSLTITSQPKSTSNNDDNISGIQTLDVEQDNVDINNADDAVVHSTPKNTHGKHNVIMHKSAPASNDKHHGECSAKTHPDNTDKEPTPEASQNSNVEKDSIPDYNVKKVQSSSDKNVSLMIDVVQSLIAICVK